MNAYIVFPYVKSKNYRIFLSFYIREVSVSGPIRKM